MSTDIRPEVSERNKYWISKHRYYELKHFCLQYPYWISVYKSLDGSPKAADPAVPKGSGITNPTEQCALPRAYFAERIEMVRTAARNATVEFDVQIIKAVTEGLSYEHIRAQTSLPCSKDEWYELYRRFFWLLDKARQ